MQSANIIAVGTIAFHVLVIHSGTMIRPGMIRARWQEALLCAASLLTLTILLPILLIPLFGRGVALLAPGSVLGGGASCAIASRSVLDGHPQLAVFPWLVFMVQGLFCVPLVTWAAKKEGQLLLEEYRLQSQCPPAGAAPGKSQKPPLWQRLPEAYRTNPYYLGVLMAAYMCTALLHRTVLSGAPINPNITALLLGLLLGSAGLIQPGPLFSSDSYGLLILGLMGLMANTLAHTPWQAAAAYIPALLTVFVLSMGILLLCALAGAFVLNASPYRMIALVLNGVMGYPVNDLILRQVMAAGKTEQERQYLRSQLGPVLGMGTTLISNGLSIITVGILVQFL